MAEAQGLYAETLTAITAATTTYVDCASIPDTSFTASRRYIIFASAFVESTSASVNVRARLVHGTTPTAFTDATYEVDVQGGGSGRMLSWLFIYDQPSTAELVKIQIANAATSTTTCRMSQIAAIALNDLVENTDYFQNEVTVDYTVTGTATAQAAVTFTPNGTDDWLICGAYAGRATSATQQLEVQLHDSVSATVTPQIEQSTDEVAVGVYEGNIISRVFTPSAVSHTFSIRFRNSGANAGEVRSSRIFALNLEKFAQHFDVYTEGTVAPGSAGAFTNIQTASVTPGVTGNWFYLATYCFDFGDVGDGLGTRLQHDNSGSLVSSPNYGDTEPGVHAVVGTEVTAIALFNLRSLTSGASRTVNADATFTAGIETTVAKHRSLAGFSLELVASAATALPPLVMAPLLS